ncbi:aldehyde dehydrogenase [Fictibacillus phosphorivorans]|uniref:Aldehyde dehydrogenase n=1 Tax=Fictibacillus phosphorivorans TaxID=1221500 RepID=A0A161RRR9_9BACL|nr:aldehyde dehydrogenase [Fictibacillus phosphorivorans]
MEEKSKETIDLLVQAQKTYFRTGKTRSYEFRMKALNNLAKLIRNNEAKILYALKSDLNKSEAEAYTTEIGFLLEEIRHTQKHLKKWMEPKKVKTAKTHFGSKGYTISEPYGVSLIIAPWNYPFQLQLAPLIGAIAAGNTAILKPSELTPHTSKLINALIKEVYHPDYIAVVEGGVETTQVLLDQPLDYIFFTGSVPVGKVIMEAASKRLIPITLELGGKSPCIVDETADIKLAAKRIAFGKFTNAGQTCIAPDYLFLHKNIRKEFIETFKEVVKSFYGEQPLENEAYGKIVNDRHFNRLINYLSDGEILFGGRYNEANEKIEPTLMVPEDSSVSVMNDEIFGPIFPVMEYEDIEEVIEFVVDRSKPLALYLFTTTNEIEHKVINNISFGGGSINDTLMHIATPYLPFGGVGESGIGSYHGESSFVAFSHSKSVLNQTNKFDFSFRYPNAKNGLKMIKKFMK